MIRARLMVHRGGRTAFTAATGAVAFAVRTTPTGTAASQLSAAGTRPAATTSAGISKLTGAGATALVTKAIANTQSAASVRVAGSATATESGTAGSGPVAFDLTLVSATWPRNARSPACSARCPSRRARITRPSP